MNRFISFLILISFIISSSFILGEEVGLSEALTAGQLHLKVQRDIWLNQIKEGKLTIRNIDYQISDSFSIKNSYSEVLAYIFDLAPEGFVAVSSDDCIEPIIAYSYKGRFDREDTQDNFLLQLLKDDMQLRQNALPFINMDIKIGNQKRWQKYLNWNASLQQSLLESKQWPEGDDDGWLQTCWSQGKFYKNSCPIDPKTKIRCVAGCPAVAMGQIIYFWKYPKSAKFSDSDNYWVDFNPGDKKGNRKFYIDVVPDGIKKKGEYEYNLKKQMRKIKYNIKQKSIADLLFACGVSIKQVYSSDASGIRNNKDVATALKKKWNYSSALYKKSSKSDFYPTMIQNMKDGLPAYLGIIRKRGFLKLIQDRHAIVVDGYRDSGTFHLNFGWGAKSLGGINETWYSLPKDLPANFSIVKEAVLNIEPNNTGNTKPKVNTFKINGGAAKTYERKVVLNNKCTGEPTHYMASEKSSFGNAEWIKYSKNPSFKLSAGAGRKTVFLKVKNKNGVSKPISDTITYKVNTGPGKIGDFFVHAQWDDAIIEIKLDGVKLGTIDSTDPIQWGGPQGIVPYQSKFSEYLAPGTHSITINYTQNKGFNQGYVYITVWLQVGDWPSLLFNTYKLEYKKPATRSFNID